MLHQRKDGIDMGLHILVCFDKRHHLPDPGVYLASADAECHITAAGPLAKVDALRRTK